ncbi:MAG: RICIN domain-containing protein, partial [Actinomycetota bacterium]|nr:RICIN domain-containing protein [Actinomycetota bacterium]
NSTDCPGDMPEGLLPQLRRDLVSQTDATPPPPARRYALQSASSGQFMDVSGASRSAGGGVIQWPNNGDPNQRWQFDPVSNDVFVIESVNSGLVLDVSGASMDPGAAVIQWPWNGGLNQQWYVHFLYDPSSNPTQVVIQSMNSGQVIDLAGASLEPGASLIQWPWAGYPNQIWWRYSA